MSLSRMLDFCFFCGQKLEVNRKADWTVHMSVRSEHFTQQNLASDAKVRFAVKAEHPFCHPCSFKLIHMALGE